MIFWALFCAPLTFFDSNFETLSTQAGEISRVESILKSELSGDSGKHINDRMVLALERRQKALEAVTQVETLMAKAKPGVEAASSLLEDVDDMSRQIVRDLSGASEHLHKALAAKTAAVKEAADAEKALTKVSEDPRLANLNSADASAAMAAAEVELDSSKEAVAAMGAGTDPAALRQEYSALKEASVDLASDTRAVVGDILSAMGRVAVLHREASDGAKR